MNTQEAINVAYDIVEDAKRLMDEMQNFLKKVESIKDSEVYLSAPLHFEEHYPIFRTLDSIINQQNNIKKFEDFTNEHKTFRVGDVFRLLKDANPPEKLFHSGNGPNFTEYTIIEETEYEFVTMYGNRCIRTFSKFNTQDFVYVKASGQTKYFKVELALGSVNPTFKLGDMPFDYMNLYSSNDVPNAEEFWKMGIRYSNEEYKQNREKVQSSIAINIKENEILGPVVTAYFEGYVKDNIDVIMLEDDHMTKSYNWAVSYMLTPDKKLEFIQTYSKGVPRNMFLGKRSERHAILLEYPGYSL